MMQDMKRRDRLGMSYGQFPSKYDGEEPEQAGTVEEVVYDTRAYATDGRNVKKSAYVYIFHMVTARKKSTIFCT